MREALGWTLDELSTRSGVDIGTISALEVRGSQRSKYAPAIAKALGRTLEELTSPPENACAPIAPCEPVNIERAETLGRIPLVSWVRAGDWCEAHATDAAEEWLPCPTRHGPNTFALRVVGDSMDGPGGYREGEVIFVDPGIAATPGRDVVARTPDGRVTFKRLKSDEAGQYLLALNPSWPDRIIRVPSGTVICGVVIGSFTQR